MSNKRGNVLDAVGAADVARIGPTEDDFIMCRTLRHAWDLLDEAISTEPSRVWKHYMWLRCTRCTTKRWDGIDVDGRVGSRKYEWPPGYRQTGTHEKLTQAEWRLVLMKRGRERRRQAAKARILGDAS